MKAPPRKPTLTIGVVNNMPDAALEHTERQFRALLLEAADERAVRIRWFALAEVERSETARQRLRKVYEPAGALWASRLDGLIVTGAEPRTAALDGESYWRALTRLVDWAEDHTTSTIWSCLAAHAAVLHTDGIQRLPMTVKLSGVYTSDRCGAHPLLKGAEARWVTPHSRWNGITAADLRDAGYEILGLSAEAGADLFIKQRGCLSVYLQGHPEYDGAALHREHRRDVRRYLSGARDDYPPLPENYYSNEEAARLLEFSRLAERRRDIGQMLDFPKFEEKQFAPHWKTASIRLYRNWLTLLQGQSSLKKAEPGGVAP